MGPLLAVGYAGTSFTFNESIYCIQGNYQGNPVGLSNFTIQTDAQFEMFPYQVNMLNSSYTYLYNGSTINYAFQGYFNFSVISINS